MSKLSSWKTISVICMLCALTAITSPAQIVTTQASFDETTGAYPHYMALIQGTDGNFYGTTDDGGTSNSGNVFKMTPWGALTTLYSFCTLANCDDGAFPQDTLVQATDGDFYGTTHAGGTKAGGTVFKMTPGGTLTTLYNFCTQTGCTDGSDPLAGLVQATNGNFYGTTVMGGAHGEGTVFEITPSGTLTTLYSFCALTACADGAGPEAALIQARNGNLYGTTFSGGADGGGVVFEMTLGGTLTVLASFTGGGGEYGGNGASPSTRLIQATNGNFYGTTSTGGLAVSSGGTVFEVTPGGSLSAIYGFCPDPQASCPDGEWPQGGLVQASNGNLYGTTEYGGNIPFGCTGDGCGTLFEITTGGVLTTLYDFCAQPDCTDGEFPYGGLMQGTNGIIYGTTLEGGYSSACGGAYGCGSIFSLSFAARISPGLVQTTDFYGDGKSDLAIWRPDTGTWYVESDGSGKNITQLQGEPGDVPVSADYDGDGIDDFAVWRPSTATWYIVPSTAPTTTITTQWGAPGDVPVPADYDGDGKTDIAVWRPSNSTWYILPSNGSAEITKQYGAAGDVPVIGDYDGDGKADYAVFRPSNGTWYVTLSSTGKTVGTEFGEPGDIPVEGDYDRDGKTDYAVWRPSTGTWYVTLSSTGKTVSQPWGMLGDIPVAGDYNGDGKNDYAVFRPSNGTWYFNYTSGGTSNQQYGATGDIPATHLPSMYRRDKHVPNFDGDRKADIAVFRPSNGTWYVIDSSTGTSASQTFGENGDIIVPGDYDGDGKTDYAVWRPSTGTWWVMLSSTGKTVNQVLGLSSDIPVPGDYDGDGKTDYAVFRPSTATWYVILSSTGQQVSQAWGASTDIPVPADYDGDGKTDYAVFRPSTATWYVILSSTGTSVHQQWGSSGDIPVPGDYDGDTKADYTVFRPSTGTWYTLQSSNGKSFSTPFGTNGDIPVARDYDGDEKTDIAVFRPSNATWYILQSSNGKMTTTQWGVGTDVPVNKPAGQ